MDLEEDADKGWLEKYLYLCFSLSVSFFLSLPLSLSLSLSVPGTWVEKTD